MHNNTLFTLFGCLRKRGRVYFLGKIVSTVGKIYETLSGAVGVISNLPMKRFCLSTVVCVGVQFAVAQSAQISVSGATTGATVSRDLHGIFFEEISHSGEGGLYGELIQNRGFEESKIPEGCTLDSGFLVPPRTPHYSAGQIVDWKMPFEAKNDYPAWSLATTGGATARIALDLSQPLYPETPRSLRIDIASLPRTGNVAVVNEGFWGISVQQGAAYTLTCYSRTEKYNGIMTARLVGADGKTLAEHVFERVQGNGWKKYTATLRAQASDAHATFQLSFSRPGTVWLDFVSLFPVQTFRNRPNGLRPDLAQYLADLKPAFVRWPGGCFVEGISPQSAPSWKKSLGPVERRPGTYSPWGYWSSDGLGYHEFLQFCEDIDADALYVFNCGVSCEMRSGVYVEDAHVDTLVASVLEAIEYAIGPQESRWGKVRAQHGHPKPFPLRYVEVGNEQVGERYAQRFNIFYTAIKEKYPQLEILAAMGIAHLSQPTIRTIEKMDIADEHAYKAAGWPMAYADWYDKYPRKDWKLYVGEYACNAGVGAGNMAAALNDATFILGLERNSDLVTMSSYAPLLENIHDTDWPVNLIRFDAGRSFARISYYAIKMLNEHKASVNLATQVSVPVDTVTPAFTGKIGLSTWDTQTEYKDVEVIQGGKVVYQSGMIQRGDWRLTSGQWEVRDSVLAQTKEGAWPLAMLNTKSFDTYTLKLKARKTGGYNAFMIPFAFRDDQHYMRVHLGAWLNTVAAFETVTKGADAIVSQPVRLEKPVELNRWYAIELRVNTTTVDCYLDGKLVMTYHTPADLFAIAGRDDKTGEVVIKIVNAVGHARPVSIGINDLALEATGTAVVLAADSPDDENSFELPQRFVPRTEPVHAIAKRFDYVVKPWSVTILRARIKRP
jgi:alpha-L-arabinofuranosidase